MTHRRQFVLGPGPFARDGWSVERLADGSHLSACPSLPVTAVTGRDGARYRLLGLAVQTDPGRPDPPDDLARASAGDLEAVTASWAGRWLLIGAGRAWTDAGGLLSCCYGDDRRGRWLSSSPALLGLVLHGRIVEPAAPLTQGTGMDWYPPPLTAVDGVRRLLPSQVLPVAAGEEPLPRPLVVDVSHLDGYERQLDDLQTRLVTAIRNLAARHPRLNVPLTGGFDSRLVLAAAVAGGTPVSTFTYTKPDAVMPYADRALPPRLAAAAGVPHRFIGRGTVVPERFAEFDEHTAMHSAEVDRDYLAYGQWDGLGEPSAVLRGGVFEIGRCYYWGRLDPGADPVAAVEASFGFDRHHAGSATHRDGLREWERWCRSHPQDGMDWRDRVYLEQRVCGWLGSLEQGLDLAVHERFHVANCKALISTLLALPVAERRESRHHVALIRRMAPPLADHPFTAVMPVRERVGNELRSLAAARDKRAHVGRRCRRLGRRLVRAVGAA